MGRSPTSASTQQGKTLVVCCDGTSNEPGASSTNVVRLYRSLEKTDRQLAFYDPGIGTTGVLDLWQRRTNRIKALAAQSIGYGLDDHVTEAYRFLSSNYRTGDRICIFGFSRGAYTARVIAGIIHQIGLLRPEQANLVPFALKAYKQSGDDDDLSVGWRFARAIGTRRATIHLLGLWDTVGSMIAPLKDRIGFGLTHLPYTRKNPSVAAVRHAMAIDEKRRMFRLSEWQTTEFVANPFDPTQTRPQDVKQVWFAGAHGDVGGGHPDKESGLAKLALVWMASEADALGVAIDRSALGRLTGKVLDKSGAPLNSAPNSGAPIHPQPSGAWKILEYFPKSASMREWTKRRDLLGYYLPRAEPRPVAPGALLHESVFQRHAADGSYRPPNLDPALEGYTNVSTAAGWP